jgi:hypothetical protein
MARRPTAQARKAHRKFAIECFNDTWTLIVKKHRTHDEDLRMVHMAHASRYHWSIAGGAKQAAIGEWQVSHVYAILRRPEPALVHAQETLRQCRKGGMQDFPLAYAYEALARASLVGGRRRDAARFLERARNAGRRIREEEDREQFFRDLKTLPKLRSP